MDVFPLPLGPLITIVPGFIVYVIILFGFAHSTSQKDLTLVKRCIIILEIINLIIELRYVKVIFVLLLMPLHLVLISGFVYFFAELGASLQMLLGSLFEIITFLFRWLSTRASKRIHQIHELRFLNELSIGMVGSAFWPICLLPWLTGTDAFFPLLTSKIVVTIIYIIRFSDFWYRFSETDR